MPSTDAQPMTEGEARDWLVANFDVSRETFDRLGQFIDLLRSEMAEQNLIAESTFPHIWARHIVDSAQLMTLVKGHPHQWIDLGSGAGFPGLIVALLDPNLVVTLVESRRKRTDFLVRAADALGLSNRITIAASRVELLPDHPYDVISARAFAPIERLLPLAARFATRKTIWVLPKGKSAASELEAARTSWQGSFRIEPSVTDPGAAIIVASDIRPRNKR